jgi:uncharacterized membrane protein YagU involved in acid resistance
MGRFLRAALLGLLVTIPLAILARPVKPALGPDGKPLPLPATLPAMKAGTAYQPFVRRQFVPFLLRTADRVTTADFRRAVTRRLESSRLIRPFLFDISIHESFDSVLCLIIWFFCIAIFLATLEAEATYYATQIDAAGAPPGLLLAFLVLTCLLMLQLFRFNYMYDPPTMCFAALALRALRRERLLELVVITALFSFNRETAFIVPGLTFFYWIYRKRPGVALWQAALLSAIYLAVAGGLAFHYRHVYGDLAQNNRAYLIHQYLHSNWKYTVFAVSALIVYTIAVVSSWKLLPPVLKAVQWFVPPWIILHILWGWPTEWRVFFEVFPGMMLTAWVSWMLWRPQRTGELSVAAEGLAA